mgnify:CR=1 FL=1
MKMHRRNFLKHTTVASSSISLTASGLFGAAPITVPLPPSREPATSLTGAVDNQIGVSTYSFSRYKDERPTVLQCIDIAADMGHLGQTLHPEVWEVIRPAANLLMDKGIPVGTLVTDPDFAAQLLNEGFTFVACGTDVGLLAQGADALRAKVRDKISET